MASDKDVFLSHSGKQKKFVRQLHRDLTREHVSCFFDEDRNSLPLAKNFPPLIFEAVETCKIAVVVLSKDFICSKWPMQELSAFVKAMKSEKNANLKLLPIFFMITPNELSHITKDSPEWQNLKVSNDTRGEWQDALKVVRSINGMTFGEDGDDLDLRDKVVREICCFLRGIKPPMLLEFKPVGIENQVREVEALLDMKGSESALAVIVYGFGGAGKSTLAASVVQSLDWSSTDFKFCRVAIDEKTSDKTSHIINLQKHILYVLGGAEVSLGDTLDGRHKIRQVLKNKFVLLFIDNVVDKVYIQDLLPQNFLFAEKTKLRIIITSRENNLKPELNIICKEYEVKGLSYAASQSLLLETIVQGEKVEDFDETSMINEVAAKCRGVPLLLSVFGKHLKVERNEDSYHEALDVLRDGNLDSYRDEDLGAKLMFVYNKIKDVEVREAFLDICTYFHGWQWNVVIDIVDSGRLKDLHKRALVSKSISGEVIVHDIFRFMGMKEARLTRFSNYKEFSALEHNLESLGNVKGISLLNDNGLITIKCTQLEAMHQSLRVLMLGDWVTLDGPPCQRAFRNLRCLRLGDITAFPFKHPSDLDKLRVFLNRSKPGMNLSHLPSSLKRISHEVPDVECDKFVKLPFQDLSSLKSFIIKTHKSLVHLDLPKDIGHLTALESLTLDRSDMERLPQGFDKLKKLKHLSMDNCSKLAFLSEELGMISSLEALSMKGCGNLKALPESMGGLLSLQTFELSGCIKLHELPKSFGELCIQSLNLHSLDNLNELPNSFGNMTLLKDLSLISCHSLMFLPDSFVQLKLLKTLRIITCTKLSFLPQDFGRLRSLEDMTVVECDLLKEFPHGFVALPALKIFTLARCNSLVNLPTDFGKLKKLRNLAVESCFQLKTLSDDFEDMATLERLRIRDCPELDGAMMEKILKLLNCYSADINGSRKLLEKWEQMQGETEHPIAVESGVIEGDRKERERATLVALLHGKCMEVNNDSGQLVERSSLLVGLEEGTSATVALFMLPIHMDSHQHQTLQRFVEMGRETAETNGSAKLQIVCARKVELYAERRIPTEEKERAEEGGIRQILLSLPKGSCAIPSSGCKRGKLLTYCLDANVANSFIGNVVVDIQGRKIIKNLKSIDVDEIKQKNLQLSHKNLMHLRVLRHSMDDCERMKLENNSIQKFIKSICREPHYLRGDLRGAGEECAAGESKTREFMEALKANRIHYLLTDNNTNKMKVDDLHEKAIGFLIYDFKFFNCIKLQQIYKDIQEKDSNFMWIWIPNVLSTDYGHGTYTRLIQCMPWATFPDPQLVPWATFPDSRLVYYEKNKDCFVVLDKHGQVANHNALPLLMGWGVKSYPFTQHTIPESFSLTKSESCLEFLLEGMNIVRRKQMKSKMTFLYVSCPREWLQKKCKLEELAQIHGSFEVLYVGKFFTDMSEICHIENLKQDYEDAIQNMSWPSLSFSDMIMFWYRCKYLASHKVYKLLKESNIKMKLETLETLLGLAQQLYHYAPSLVLVDKNGAVICDGEEVVQMICEESDEIWDGEEMGMRMVKEELMESLSRGECTPLVTTFFRDEIHDLPQHPQHRIFYLNWQSCFTCDVCGAGFTGALDEGSAKRSYKCDECEWYMCTSCWSKISQTSSLTTSD